MFKSREMFAQIRVNFKHQNRDQKSKHATQAGDAHTLLINVSLVAPTTMVKKSAIFYGFCFETRFKFVGVKLFKAGHSWRF